MDGGYKLISGVSSFASHFGIALLILVLFQLLYPLVTPQREWKLINEGKNTAAALAFGGAIVGFSIALSGAVSNSSSIADFVIWAAVASVAQVLAFAIVRFGFMPKLAERIEKNEVSAGVILLAVHIAVGLLNSACMTY